MPQTLSKLLTHIIFSTKERRALIDAEARLRLHAYLGGILRELRGKALAVGGTSDHVHLLVWLPPTVSVAEAVRILKTNSSKWLHEGPVRRRLFAWQAGYAAFSVSESSAHSVIRYIQNQERHHRRRSFQEELLLYLEKHGITHDEQYLWD